MRPPEPRRLRLRCEWTRRPLVLLWVDMKTLRTTGARARLRAAAILAALVALGPRAAAGQAIAQQPVRLERHRVEIDLRPGGEFVQVTERQVRIQTQAGLRSAGQMVFSYSESLQRFELLEAYTLKPDGRRVPVPKEAVFHRDLPVSAGAPIFADEKLVILVFPEVAVGDRLRAVVRHAQLRPLLADHYSALFSASPHELYDEVSVTLRAPASLPLRVENLGWEERVERTGDAVTRAWSTRNADLEVPEPGAISPVDYGARLVVSTFADHAALARAYDAPAREAAAVTPAIRALAERLTAGSSDAREVARRLYEWETENIRYVGVFLGNGAVVPHRADQVLASRYGDCKDHVALLQALLAAKGIPSTPALVGAGIGFWVSKVPTLGNFNHVVTYVPSLDLFLDTTAAAAPFGRLPEPVQGKTALVTATGELRRTPLDGVDDNTSRRRVRFEIRDDGAVAGVTEIEAKGWRAVSYRELARSLTPEQVPEFVRRQTTDDRYRGEGTVEFFGAADRSDVMKLRATYTLSGGIEWPGAGSFPVPVGFRGKGAMYTQPVQGAVAWKRPHVFGPCEVVEEYEIALPAGMKIVSLPADVKFANGITSYEATYRQAGRKLLVTRRLRDRFQPPLIAPSEARAMEAYSAVIARYLRQEIAYTRE